MRNVMSCTAWNSGSFFVDDSNAAPRKVLRTVRDHKKIVLSNNYARKSNNAWTAGWRRQPQSSCQTSPWRAASRWHAMARSAKGSEKTTRCLRQTPATSGGVAQAREANLHSALPDSADLMKPNVASSPLTLSGMGSRPTGHPVLCPPRRVWHGQDHNVETIRPAAPGAAARG